MKRTLPLIACILVACSPDPDPESNSNLDQGFGAKDVSVVEDGGPEADTGADSGPSSDASPDMALNGAVDITATVGDVTEGFDRAYYGLTAPEQTASGNWEIHVEVYAGGDEGCPQMDSPTPDRTLVIGGLSFPEVPTEQREEDGVAIALLDFAGTLTDEPTLSATGEIVFFQQWSLCTDCEGDDPDGYVSFDVDALLEDGNIRGHVYATHCASLNTL
jgi:hypothetical protein